MPDFEYAKANERQFDFCLWEYPAAASTAGKLRSINLLAHSLDAEGLGHRAQDVIQGIRRGLGDSNSVWGIKQEAGKISWEFYFYDYDRQERERSVGRLLEVVRPWIPCDVVVADEQPYFMFSIDFGRAQLVTGAPIEEVQVYIGNIGSLVSSGICYAVSKSRTELKNFYFFFDAKKQMADIVGKLTSSIYLDLPGFAVESLLWPELCDCQTIVVANKRDRDGVYFCRINVGQLLYFLKRMDYPAEQVAFVERNKGSLDHMLYDVGIDYRVEGGALKIVKSAYYGVF